MEKENQASKEKTFTYNIQGSMIKTIKAINSKQDKGCIKSKGTLRGHGTNTKHFLANQPEVMMLSLSWPEDQPLPSEIMRTLISISEIFSTEDLYTLLD